MGTRINFYVLAGIHDAKVNTQGRYVDSRFIEPDNYRDESFWNRPIKVDRRAHPFIKADLKNKTLFDKFYSGAGTGSNSNLIGYIIDKGNNGSWLMYALAIHFGKSRSGYAIIKNRQWTKSDALRTSYFPLAYQEHIAQARKENRHIPYFDYIETDGEYRNAEYVLQYAGWNIKRPELKLMLVWDWS